MASDYQILTQSSGSHIDFSNFETLGKIEYINEGSTADQQYPQFAGGAVNTYVFAANERSYTLLIHLNFVTLNLFFSLIDTNGTHIAKYRKLAELPAGAVLGRPPNLLNGVLAGCELYFYNWSLHFRASE